MSVGCRDLIPEVLECVLSTLRFVDGRNKKTLRLLPKINDLILDFINLNIINLQGEIKIIVKYFCFGSYYVDTL